MERKRKNRPVELCKDLVILLLALSAVYLLGRTQFYDNSDRWFSGSFSFLPFGDHQSPSQPAGGWGQGGVMRPVRIAMTSGLGCYGLQYDSAGVNDLFGQLINPLSDALSAASAPQQSSAREWRAALAGGRTGVYLDFLGNIPLANLYAWISGGGAPNENLTGTARRLLLSITESGDTVLYYINESDGLYYACHTTADLASRLSALVEGASPNAIFAFEDQEQYGGLAPYTLLGFLTPQPHRYAASNPLPLGAIAQDGSLSPESQAALETFAQSISFHPQSYTTYLIPDGLAIREGGDTLTVTASGEVTFRSSGEESASRYPIAVSGAEAQPWEVVDGAWAFVENALGGLCGDARLYLIDAVQEEDATALYFGYQLGGAAVQVGSEGYAAKILVKKGQIDQFTFQLRSYADTGETTLVMQELRAAAAMDALDAQGAELLLCYLDRGGDQVTAGWIAQ